MMTTIASQREAYSNGNRFSLDRHGFEEFALTRLHLFHAIERRLECDVVRELEVARKMIEGKIVRHKPEEYPASESCEGKA